MILVVGGAGYIGSHVTRQLRLNNLPHVVFDNFESGHREAIQGSPYFEGDLRNPASIAEAFRSYEEITAVMHFGAYISVGESVREPAKYYNNNVLGTLNLLEEMRRTGVKQIVFSSTAAVYGEPQEVPIPEDHVKAPVSPYGESKWICEQMITSFCKAYDFRTVIFRYFNACGADPRGGIGEDHHPEEHLVPLAIQAVMGLRPALKVFGNDYPTPDGTCVRDYIHVVDLADAHLMGIDYLKQGGKSDVLNLGNGSGFSVQQVIETVAEVSGKPVPHEVVDRRPGDPAVLIANASKAKATLGWEPKFANLSNIVSSAWRWHSEFPNGYTEA